jgi:hypothetical protein
MRLIAEGGHGVEYPGAGGLADPPAAIQYVRDGLPADPGGLGYILDGRIRPADGPDPGRLGRLGHPVTVP